MQQFYEKPRQFFVDIISNDVLPILTNLWLHVTVGWLQVAKIYFEYAAYVGTSCTKAKTSIVNANCLPIT